MDSWKAEVRRVRRDKIRRKKMQVREKVGTSWNTESRETLFFQWFVAPVGRKVGSLKRRVRRQLARWEMKNCTPLWREAHFQVKMYKTLHVRATFGSCGVEKVQAVVARSTFPSQNAQSTPASDHFWKLRCRKSARHCGAKHISKSKCTKHTSFGLLWKLRCRKSARRCGPKRFSKSKSTKHYMFAPLLEVQMSKKCTPLWRQAHFQVKMYKAHQLRTTFGSWDVEKVHAVVARSTFRSQNVQNTPASDHFWKLRCRKSARRCGANHISKSKSTKHYMFAPLLEVQMSKKCTPLWREAHFEVKLLKTTGVRTTFGGSDVASLHYTTLHYTTLHSTTLRSTTLHYITQHYNYNYTTTLHYTKLHYITLHYTTLHYTTLHHTTLHYLPLHLTTLHSTTLQLQLQLQLHNYTPLQYTPLQYTPLHSTTLNYTTLHYITLHSTTLHYTTLPSTTLHYIALHYTPLHYNYNYNYDYTTTLHYTPLHEITLRYTTLHSTTLHYTTLHYTTLHYTEWHCTTDRQVDR